MEAKPLRIVPYSHYSSGKGGGPRKKIDRGHAMEGVVEEEKRVLVKEVSSISSSCVELDLGVGATHFAAEAQPTNPVIAARACLFTEAQRRELEHQVFIFKHFANNLPVPQHLVLPVLNSASGTLHSGFGGFHKQYPSYMSVSESGGQGFDYGSMMDPEPHRCRRTDGKKWRCGRNVVPHQKYCERHMHRGRNRSRKPVESSEVNTSLITKPVETSEVNSSVITKPSGKLHTKLASNTESAVSNPNPLGIQLIDSSSCTPSKSCIVNPSSANNKLKNVLGSADCQTSFAPMVTPFSRKTSVTSNNRNSLNVCKKNNHTKSCISNSISGGKGNIICERNSISTGIGFSPRSVLQVSGCDHSYLNDRNSIGLEPSRCRRTDGKKWRCRGAVLPGQKYCARHMHRGAKKRFVDNEPATATTPNSGVTFARLPYSTATSNTQKAHGTTPNTNLSMSVPASAPLPQCNEKSPTSSDTDTTITDTMNEYSCDSY